MGIGSEMYSRALVTKPLYRKDITIPIAMDYCISKRTETSAGNTCNLEVQVILVLTGIFFPFVCKLYGKLALNIL